MLLRQTGKFKPDITGLSPSEQLERIRERAGAMVDAQYRLLQTVLMPLMEEAGLSPLPLEELTEAQHAGVEEYFISNIAPVLTPLALEVEQPPMLPNLSLILGVELQPEGADESRFVAITLPDVLPRRVQSALLGRNGYVMLEDVVSTFCPLLFPGETVVSTTPFRVTRNGDIAVAEE